jgi:TRAP-type mannitol/chloroaromatic compound transport system permease large subunit
MLFSLTNPEIAIFMMGLFLFAVLLGFPIAFTLMAMGLGFGYYAYFDPTKMEHLFDNRIFQLFVQNTYTVMDNNVLTAVPLFLFMGYLVERAGIVAKLFFAIRLASHKLPASMAVAALVTCTLFSTATGIIGAVVTLMGLLAWPAMVKAGYDKKFASGIICAGGCLRYFNSTKHYVNCVFCNRTVIAFKIIRSSYFSRINVGKFIYWLCNF